MPSSSGSFRRNRVAPVGVTWDTTPRDRVPNLQVMPWRALELEMKVLIGDDAEENRGRIRGGLSVRVNEISVRRIFFHFGLGHDSRLGRIGDEISNDAIVHPISDLQPHVRIASHVGIPAPAVGILKPGAIAGGQIKLAIRRDAGNRNWSAGIMYHVRVCTWIVGNLSVNDQSVIAPVTRSPFSHKPGLLFLGCTLTIRRTTSATTRKSNIPPTILPSVFMKRSLDTI